MPPGGAPSEMVPTDSASPDPPTLMPLVPRRCVTDHPPINKPTREQHTRCHLRRKNPLRVDSSCGVPEIRSGEDRSCGRTAPLAAPGGVLKHR
ncbi:hypothetical protein MTP99_011656 [Tenebrio molitor]|nr:hypothetical protein MTP99_011656 [Tenebrio molitor]